MIWRTVRGLGVSIVLGGMISAVAHAIAWFPMGPFGGDARSLAADPFDSKHLYLGTETGWLYESHDGGNSWLRVSQIGKRDDLVLKSILIDPTNPKRLIVGVFKFDHPDGGVFISDDAGKNWYEQAEMRGQSVRSMARSLSKPQEIVAGTLSGIYRSVDNGLHWVLISPPGSTDIHEVESLAIDPVNPEIIYAGTWHLPWKTVDGGLHWVNIKEGIFDDSDVFSIIVDPARPNIVYASACSGIYKSVTGAAPNPRDVGKRFDKIQGIPSTARRTRKLLQDPNYPDTVYAGTTEGLYKTIDGGASFLLMTGPNVIVNDVYVDPKDSNHVLLATDRGGVLSSIDGGVSFQSSNVGFSARQVSAYAADSRSNATIYVGLVNDKAIGGVFQSVDGGLSWQQRSEGLGGRDVFSLVSTPAGTLLAGTAHGIFRLSDTGWVDSGTLIGPPTPKPAQAAPKATAKPRARARTVAVVSTPSVAPAPSGSGNLDTIVYSLVADGDFVYAGTSRGLLRAADDGNSWGLVSTLKMPETRFVATHESMVMAAGLRRISLSMDGGVKWDAVALPPDLTQIACLGIDELKNLWVGGTEGVYYSTDYGLTWKTLHNLYLTEVNGIFFDGASHQVLVTSSNQKFAFGVHLPDYKVSFWDTGWSLRFVRPVGDHLIGATMFDGMVLQPRMVASAIAK